MQPKFRLAIVGAGQITMSAHLKAALALPFVEVAALIDRSEARVRNAGRFFGRDFAYFPSVGGAARRRRRRARRNAEPRAFRRRQGASRTADSGACRKAADRGLAEADELVALGKANGTLIAVGYSTRFRQSVELAARLVAEERFGKVESFSYISGSKGGWSPVEGYIVPGKRVGGVLTVHGAHFIDRMLNWFGYPAAFEYYDDGEAGPEANCVAKFEFEAASPAACSSRKPRSSPTSLWSEPSRDC